MERNKKSKKKDMSSFYVGLIAVLTLALIVFIAVRNSEVSHINYNDYCKFKYGNDFLYEELPDIQNVGLCIDVQEGIIVSYAFNFIKIEEEYYKCPGFFELNKRRCEFIKK